MVTHDQEEALLLADRIICMNHGRVEQSGTPEDLYLRPATHFVADFMGVNNLIKTEYVRECLPKLMDHRPVGDDRSYVACVRPEQITLSPEQGGGATVRDISFLGNVSRIRVDSPAGELMIETHGHVPFALGQQVRLDIWPEDCPWVSAPQERHSA